jgi:hypothetical protein
MNSTKPQPLPTQALKHFNSGEYRICSIELEDSSGKVTTVYCLGQPSQSEHTILQFGKPFQLRVEYECLLPQIPEFSCGVGCALTLVETMEHVMYFNTSKPHSDEELQHYFDADFRKYRGRHGVVEASIAKLQAKPSNYLLTVAIIENHPSEHVIYEIHYLQYPITVLSDGPDIPAAFYPNVKFRYEPL